MKNKPAPTTIRMTCPRCATQVLILSPPDNPYPVKLPGQCPCCWAQITEYYPVESDAP